MQSFFLLILMGLVTSQSNPDDSTPDQTRKRRTSDPVSNFFSELGDLILDVDQSIAVHSQPKIEREANIVSQLLRPTTDYFDRIQKNYQDMQKRIGKLIGDTIGIKDTYSEHELSTVSPPPDKFVPTIEPDHNPFAAVEARKGKLKERISKGNSREYPRKKSPGVFFDPEISIPKAIPEGLKAFGKLSKAIIDDIDDFSRSSSLKSHAKARLRKEKVSTSEAEECSDEVLADPDLEQRRKERCSRVAAEGQLRADLKKSKLEPKRTSEALFSKTPEALDKLSESFLSRSGHSLTESSTSDEEMDPGIERSDAMAKCWDKVLEDSTLEKVRREKCLRDENEKHFRDRLHRLAVKSNLVPAGSKAIDDLSSVLVKRSGSAEGESLSEMSNLDLFFDKHIRQLIKDHGSWILDYPLLKRWRHREGSSDSNVTLEDSVSKEIESSSIETTSDVQETEPTEIYIPVSTDIEIALQKSGDIELENPHESSYYKIVNENGDVEEEIDFVLDPEALSHDIGAAERLGPKETFILAFTSDGVPLKIRLGPEIDNPLQYLHKVLQSASVSLNVPVESYDDIEPVGKEILKLGSGILTRAVLINASNPNELKSLLKALMVTKSSRKTIV